MERGYSTFIIKRASEVERTIEGWCSTPSVDLAGDVVEPSGMRPVKGSLPLLWQHSPSQPIGRVLSVTPSSEGVWFKAQLAKVDEPGTLRDRLTEAWQSIAAGLVRGISIGFTGVDWDRLATGGRRWKSWILHEVSCVTIPCNVDCTAATVKRYARQSAATTSVIVRLDRPVTAQRKVHRVVRLEQPSTLPIRAAINAAIDHHVAHQQNPDSDAMLARALAAGAKATDAELAALAYRLAKLEAGRG
jgi:HK97 family phage prohead protease